MIRLVSLVAIVVSLGAFGCDVGSVMIDAGGAGIDLAGGEGALGGDGVDRTALLNGTWTSVTTLTRGHLTTPDGGGRIATMTQTFEILDGQITTLSSAINGVAQQTTQLTAGFETTGSLMFDGTNLVITSLMTRELPPDREQGLVEARSASIGEAVSADVIIGTYTVTMRYENHALGTETASGTFTMTRQ